MSEALFGRKIAPPPTGALPYETLPEGREMELVDIFYATIPVEYHKYIDPMQGLMDEIESTDQQLTEQLDEAQARFKKT